MEALNSASLGAMGSLLRKLHELLHNEDRAPNIVQLVELVGSISTKLVKLSDVHDPPLTVKCWMIDARELSCDMENCVDQADTLSKIDWIDEILGFKTRAEEVIERFERFKLDYVLSHPTVPNIAVNNRLGTVYREQKPTVPIGMEGPTNKLLGLLEPKGDDENELRLKVVSILGVAGIGKSMLVHELWWKLREGSQCCAFVQAAKKPDMRMILRSILLQIRPHQPLQVFQVPKLIHDIRKHLQDKRYFIIIDDIWAISFWDVVSRAFPDGYCRSRIITTTAVDDVAQACCSYDLENIFKMKRLSDNHSKDLFISIVFGSGKGCPQQFYDVSHEITRKCGGLPLAITCIATLVSSLPGTLQQWEYVQNFLYHNLRRNSTSEEVLKQVLELCFSSLPEFLKTCLLYLSVYPENYIIMKEELAKQWTAEGFICTSDGRDNVEVAESYFDELVSLGLIQGIDINSKKGRLSYIVHPVVFDFITCKSIEHNFITMIDYSQSVIQLSNKIRRLSLHFGSATYAATPASFGLSQVRSLAFMGLLNCMPSLEEFKLVRVVILHFRGDDGSPSFPLTRILGLLWLRYLQIKCNITVELPDHIKCLKHLETLDINARVASFTSGLLHVPSLLHVRLGGKTSPTLSPVASGAVISLDDSSNSSSFLPIFLRRLELVPPTCIFSRLPEWIRQLRKLCTLQIVVRELSRNDMSVLTQLPALSALSLYVWTPIVRDIFFSKMEFPALEYFKFVCSALLLGFEEETMPNLRRLKIGFNAEKGWSCRYMLPGIQNLLNLKEVDAKIGAEPGAEESDQRAAESAFMDAVRMHPCHPKLKMKRVGRVLHTSGEVNTSELIGGIGRELAISCLLRLPRAYYLDVACVNRSFYNLVKFGELYRLRREAGIVEPMIYCSCNVLEWEGFDPCRQRWFSIPSMPHIECFTQSDKESLAVGTNILVFGAHVVLRYSLLTNSWTTGEMMNTPRCLFGSASFGEKAIVAGGFGQNGALSSAELYDSEMRTWTTLPNMNRARQMCSGFFMDGKFYVIGGKAQNEFRQKEAQNEGLSCAEEFDLENRTWRLIPDMAQGLNGGNGAPTLVAVVNNQLYAVDYATKEVRKYDKVNNSWITLGLLPGRYTSVHGWGIAFRSCGDMLIVVGAVNMGGGGLIEICSWVPDNGPPDWKIIGTRRSGSFVYNFAVMSC